MLNTPVLDKLHGQMKPPHDFGSNVFPNWVDKARIQAHLFDGYWEDLGTIKSYHEANLALADVEPPFDFYQPDGLIYTRMRNLPAAKIDGATLSRTVVSDGCRVGAGSTLDHCLIGVRSRIGDRCHLTDTILIGADRYETDQEQRDNVRTGHPMLNVGDGTRIRTAILDKDCRVGKNVVVENAAGVAEYDHPQGLWHVRDGIVCIPRGAVIPDGTVI